MTRKSTYFLLFILLPLFLAACVSRVFLSPTADQKQIATIVAATVDAASTATQRAMPVKQTPAETKPIIPTTQPSPPTVTTLPSASPSPTAGTGFNPSLHIAYIKGGDIYLWKPSTGSQALTGTHDAIELRISDDGLLIAYKRQAGFSYYAQELWLVDTSGAPNPRVMVSTTDLLLLKQPDPSKNILGYGVLSFTWRPNTHDLAYNTLVLHEGPGFGPNYDLRLVNADTLDKTTLMDTGEGGIFFYSPDGSQVALSNPDSISLMNADGSNPRSDVLTFPRVITYSENEYHPEPIWAQDSSSLRVTIPPEDPLAQPRLPTGLWSIPVDGSPAVLLGSIPAMAFAWPDNAFSPDLEHVGYATDAVGPEPNQRELRIANPDGSGDTVYDSGESLEFTGWSPDSQHFIYVIHSGSKEGLYIGRLNDPPIQINADPQSIADVQWVDGTRLAYLVYNNNQWELRISDVNAEDLAFIDTLPDSNPAFDVLP